MEPTPFQTIYNRVSKYCELGRGGSTQNPVNQLVLALLVGPHWTPVDHNQRGWERSPYTRQSLPYRQDTCQVKRVRDLRAEQAEVEALGSSREC